MLAFELGPDTVFDFLDLDDLGFERDVVHVVFQPLLQDGHEVAIRSGQKTGHRFNYADLRTQSRVNAAQFQADVAATDDEKLLGDVFQEQCRRRVHDPFGTDVESWDFRGA
jgi:hypothetical protein